MYTRGKRCILRGVCVLVPIIRLPSIFTSTVPFFDYTLLLTVAIGYSSWQMERGLKYNGFMAQVSGVKDCAAASGTLQGQCHELEHICFEGPNILIKQYLLCMR